MDTVIYALLICSSIIMIGWVVLMIQMMKQGKIQRRRSQLQKSAAQLSKKAKLEADQQMIAAVEKATQQLQNSLQNEVDTIHKTFQANMLNITSQTTEAFNKTLQDLQAAALSEVQSITKNQKDQTVATKNSMAAISKEAKSAILHRLENNATEILLSYLAEVAGDLDYHQQKDYLYKALEANKKAIKKDVEGAL